MAYAVPTEIFMFSEKESPVEHSETLKIIFSHKVTIMRNLHLLNEHALRKLFGPHQDPF